MVQLYRWVAMPVVNQKPTKGSDDMVLLGSTSTSYLQSTFMWPWKWPSFFLNITTSQILLSWTALNLFSPPCGCDWSHYWQPAYI